MSEAAQTGTGSQSAQELPNDIFVAIAKLAHSEAGLMIPESKRALVQSRISRRLRALGLSDFEDYLEIVSSEAGRNERRNMVSVLTTNVSSFFRENHHFDLLATLAPDLVGRARAGERVRVWSAGCSSGQEAYSVAMILSEAGADAGQHDIRILASDIDPAIIARARAAEFDAAQMAGVAPGRRQRFFDASGAGIFRVRDPLRRMICFRELNLLAAWPMKGTFDIIFCRNVVIYFDEATQLRLWPRFRAALAPEGLLLLGHSERIASPASLGFEVAGVTTYRAVRRSEPVTRSAGAALLGT